MMENIIEILLVEDNPGDSGLVIECLKHNAICNRVHLVEDGEEAVQYLKKTGIYRNAMRPDLILLDLNLPKKDGREVLSEIKNDDALKTIPVVVMTTSKSEEDIFRSYNLHANCYIQKPLDFEQFTKVIRSIEDFWFTIVKLPNHKK